jgi:hypothetical protein
MISINNNVNGYWQQAGIYGQQTTTFTNALASQGYKPNSNVPKMDMQSMFKIMFQMIQLLQGMQGQRYGQTQSIFSNSANPSSEINPADDSLKFVSPRPVATAPTPAPATANSTAFLFAMLLSQSGMSSILPNLASGTTTTPSDPVADTGLPVVTTPITTSPNPVVSTPTSIATKPPTPVATPTTDTSLPLVTSTTLTTLPTPTQVEPKPPANEKVYIVGGYGGSLYNLGDTVLDFTDLGYEESSWHNADKSNDKLLEELAGKMSRETKGLGFGNISDRPITYIISESGKVIDQVDTTQIVDGSSIARKPLNQASTKNKFEILNDLGVNKTNNWFDSSVFQKGTYGIVNLEEATGGKIKLDGKEYDVITTAIRKDTPLTFDLNGDGVKTSDKMIQYDIDGDGTVDNINDVADGTLTIRGGATGKDLFGNNTDLDGDGKADGFKNGFDALKTLALQEGIIDGKQDMVLDANDLALLQKKYQLAMKTAGYNSKNENLGDLGIGEINLGKTNATQTAQNFDGQGNDLMTQEGSTFTLNGKTQDYADVWHQLK